MRKARALLHRVAGFLAGKRHHDGFAAELDTHLQMHIEDNLRAGMPAEEARRNALIKLGGLTQTTESYRERRGLPVLDTLLADLRFGVRMLSKNPGFTAVAALTLALGIAANATIFSFVSAILFRTPTVEDANRLMVIYGTNARQGFGPNLNPVSAPNYFAWKEANKVFSDMAAADAYENASITGEGEPLRVQCMRATANYFTVLGVPAAIGRTFAEGEDRAGHDHVVVLSHALWKEHFGEDAGVAGKTIRLNGEVYTVVGVMPASFRLLSFAPKIWTPLVLDANQQSATARETRNLQLFGRLKPGVSAERARADLAALGALAQEKYPDTEKGWGVGVLPLQEYMIRDFNSGPALAVLMSTVGFVLLIACANIAGLLLARGAARSKEMAIRAALGAGRLRVVRQLLTEALLIAVLGGVAGLALTYWGARLLRTGLNFNDEVSMLDIRIDGTVLFYTGAVAVLAALLFGLAPAVRAGKVDVYGGLKNDSATVSGGRAKNRLRNVLVAGEIALAIVLLSGTGIFIKGLYESVHQPMGFDPQHSLMARISLDGSRYADTAKQLAFFQNLLERLQTIPGVQAAAVATDLPATGAARMTFRLKGQENLASGERPSARYFAISADYLRATDIALRAGREFRESDGAGAAPVAIVSEVFVKRFFPDKQPIGQAIQIDSADTNAAQWREIVGVVANVKNWPTQAGDDPEIYTPFLQNPASDMAVLIRTEGNPGLATPELRRAVWSIDKDLPAGSPVAMDELLNSENAGERVMGTILSIFSALAVILSSVGLYGLVSYSVAQRNREIGIRVAMGAAKSSVLRLVVGSGMKLALAGAAVGILLALPLPALFTAMFQDFQVQGGWLFVAVPLAIFAVAILACYIPARRAAKVDPMVALRYE